MNNKISSTVAGMTLGALAGVTTYMVMDKNSSMIPNTQKMKRTTKKAIKGAENIIGTVTDMVK